MRLLYTNSDSLSSRLITGFDSGGVSHGGIEFPDHRPGEVLDSTWRHDGVRWWPKAQWLTMHGRRLMHDFEVLLPDEDAAFAFASAQKGKPYDRSAIFGISVLRDCQDDEAWYCFELQIVTCLRGGKTIATSPTEIGGRLSLEWAYAWSQGREATPRPSRYLPT